jgi:3-oxoacyl-[acyl-carrier protein] reductase
MTSGLADAHKTALLENVPVKRLGDANEIAAAVAYLASVDAGYVTGETLHVNGGMYMA